MQAAPDRRDTTFAVLSLGVSLALFFNYSASWIAWTPLTVVAVAVAVLTMFHPRSPWALGGLCLAYAIQYLHDDRHPYIHTHLDLIVVSAVALTLGATWEGPQEDWRTRFVRAFAPIGVAIAGISFFAAGFAKVNIDFANPAISCGTSFYESARTVFPYRLLPSTESAGLVGYGVVGFTWLAELSGPLLLLFARTRRVGFLLIFGLCFVLGTTPIGRLYEFTSPFVALFSLCFVAEVPAARVAATPLGGWISARSRVLWWTGFVFVAAVVVAAMLTDHTTTEARYWATRIVYIVWMLLLVLPLAWMAPVADLSAHLRRPWLSHASWMVVLYVMCQELTPYLGIRAQGALVMAANFSVTPTHSNHLVVRSVPRLPFNHPAVLIGSSDERLNRKGRNQWPTWMLFDYLARHPEDWATVRIDGESITFEAGSEDPRIRRNPMALLFPVEMTRVRAGPNRCGH